MFAVAVLLVSSSVIVLPQAIALNPNPVDNSHVTDRFYGHMKVCGVHLCEHGQKTEWQKSVWGHQDISQGKITHPTQHGEDVMSKLSGHPTTQKSAHGSEKPTVHSQMPVINATKSEGMTGMPNTK